VFAPIALFCSAAAFLLAFIMSVPDCGTTVKGTAAPLDNGMWVGFTKTGDDPNGYVGLGVGVAIKIYVCNAYLLMYILFIDLKKTLVAFIIIISFYILNTNSQTIHSLK
jgi:hypothetical protein